MQPPASIDRVRTEMRRRARPPRSRRAPAFVAHDPRFAAVTGDAPRLELVAETDAHEGPAYAADGLKVDAAGRVYTSSADGVQIYHPSGDLLGEIRLPGAVNFAFGGPGRDVLFITSDTAVWAAALAATGA